MDNNTSLPIIPLNQAVDKAYKEVEKERSGKQHGLYTSFSSLNRSAGKYFRFGQVNLWAGLSGSGKSYLLNIISNDFLNKELNANLPFNVILLNFSFEMSSHTEVLRTAASDLGLSYAHLLSSAYNKETGEYNRMSDSEMVKLKAFLDSYSSKAMLYVETSSNVNIVYNTIKKVANKYLGNKNEEGEFTKTAKNGKPNKLVVNFDHTLLFEKLTEKDLLDLMLNIGKLSIKIRKEFNAMVNMIGQLNNKIEEVIRLTTPALHYPQKSDIYAQGQIYNACDNVYIIHQPHALKIQFYGLKKLPTKNLIHINKIKSRHGNIGSIWLKNNLENGKIEEMSINNLKENKKIEKNSENLDEIPPFMDNLEEIP